MEWTDGMIAKLSNLWAEGLSTPQIGLRLGVSKNAVIGKSHRLGLPSRENPVGKFGSSPHRVRLPRRPQYLGLPPLASKLSPGQTASLGRRPPQAAPVVARVVGPTPKVPGMVCQFPTWGHKAALPRDVTKRFCEAATWQGVYCFEHWGKCHEKQPRCLAEAA